VINLGMSLFELARKQLEKEKKKFTPIDVIDRAVKIRKQLDKRAERQEKTQFKKQ
jgi:hypothetical protein